MGVVANLLTGESVSFLESHGDWSVDSPHGISHTRVVLKYPELGSLVLTSGDGSDITITHASVPVGSQYGWGVRFFAWIYPESQAQVTMQIEQTLSSDLIETETQTIRGSQWSLCSVLIDAPFESSFETPTITISGLSTGEKVYITNPTIFAPGAISKNVFAAEVWLRLPEYLRDADTLQSGPDLPLLRFIDVMFNPADEVYRLWDRYRYIQPKDAFPGDPVSELEPSNASVETLRWWRQLLGVTFYDPTSGTTSWANLEAVLDTWDDWEDEIDPAPGGPDTSWDEIEDLNPGVGDFVESLRWQIITAYFGLRGGTKTAVVESVKKTLTGTKHVVFIEHDGGDPWAIRIQTKQSETPDEPTIGDPSNTLLEFVANSIPTGYELIHETIA